MSRWIGSCAAGSALVLMCLCFAAGGGAAGATRALVDLGARYDGRSNNMSYAASVWVASRSKSRFGIYFKQGRCSDGGAYSGYDFPLKHQGFTIGASGGAGFAGYYKHAYWFTRHGRKVWGRERFAVIMQFAGDTVTGVLTDRFVSARLHCSSGPVSFTAWRDGSAAAPLNTSYGTTGWYRGKSGYGDSMSMYVFLPLRLVTTIRITFWHGLYCSGGLRVTGPLIFRFYDIPINGTGFTLSGHNVVSSARYHYHQRWKMTGNPLRGPVWNFVVTTWRHGHRISGTCTTSPSGYPFTLKPPHGRPV